MIKPYELTLELPMDIPDGMSTTSKVWEILRASNDGDLDRIKELVKECPGLIYATFNYAPPIYFAVREGHATIVKYLLSAGALDPNYGVYPFRDSLVTIAQDRGYEEIFELLQEYVSDPSRSRFKDEDRPIHFRRSSLQQQFQEAVDREDLKETERLLKQDPGLVHDPTYFWGEGILMMPAKENNRELVELLMYYGAQVPGITKWAQFYYFEKYEMMAFLLGKGVNPNHMSWQHARILHDMAHKGNLPKAELLLKHGAEIDPIDDLYLSTPLGIAVRWGHTEMVKLLLSHGADANKSGAPWSTPLSWAQKKGHNEIARILIDAGAI